MKRITKNAEALKRAALGEVERVRAARAEAFKAETDPMVGQVLSGEISLDTFIARRKEIRARHPYPEETI